MTAGTASISTITPTTRNSDPRPKAKPLDGDDP